MIITNSVGIAFLRVRSYIRYTSFIHTHTNRIGITFTISYLRLFPGIYTYVYATYNSRNNVGSVHYRRNFATYTGLCKAFGGCLRQKVVPGDSAPQQYDIGRNLTYTHPSIFYIIASHIAYSLRSNFRHPRSDSVYVDSTGTFRLYFVLLR